MPHALASPSLTDRASIVDWHRRTRARSTALFDLLTPDAYYAQPIALRHPIVFYEGHLAAFSLNTLVKKALGRPGIDARLERLFARGIDPDDEQAARGSAPGGWPERSEVRAFADAADTLVLDALQHADLDRPDVPMLERGQAVYAIIEHEQMHQETMLYMWHQLPYDQKTPRLAENADARSGQAAGGRRKAGRAEDLLPPRPRAGYVTNDSRRPDFRTSPAQEAIEIPPGRARLGACRGDIPFGWDNEFEAVQVDVPAFFIDRFNVTNSDFLEFVEAGGYQAEHLWTPEAWQWVREEHVEHPKFWEKRGDGWAWRSMFESLPLRMNAPVYVSQAEAAAYARWRGRRLPSEAEFHRAAYGTPGVHDRAYPWGDDAADATRGVFDFSAWDPEPVGSHRAGASAWGVEDLVGNGWEWTSTIFAPFDGFVPLPSYPEYSADFFDRQHFVMKGGSPATARELLRPTFRNWFRPHYPYVYATFRCATESPATGGR